MKLIQRGVGIVFLLALVIVPFGLDAQDDDTINVVGSGIVNPLVESLASASDAEFDLDVNTTGTGNGFTAFCSGDAEIATATRPISIEEEDLCSQNGIEYEEYLIGHNVLTLIANPDFESVQCLDLTAINDLFAPSATGNVTDWIEIGIVPLENAEDGVAPITLFVPPQDTILNAALDDIVDGVGIRTDVIREPDAEAIIAGVVDNRTALGVVSLSDVTEDVRVLNISTDPAFGCQEPTAVNIENRLYTLADRLFMYVNRAAKDRPGMETFLSFATSAESGEIVNEAGFTPPSEEAYTLNNELLTGEEAGRQFSQDVVAFEIPPDVFGQVDIAGSAHANDYFNALTTRFSGNYPSVTVNLNTLGEPHGLRRLCNGEIGIAIVRGELSEEEAENCAANNIETQRFDLGDQPVVLLANSEGGYPQCLSREQIVNIWSSEQESLPETWNQVSEEFPETDLTLVAPTGTDAVLTDLLLTPAEGAVQPLRTDVTETNADPLYRAAAVANVEGALTYMSWDAYQDVIESEQENVQLVQVSTGDDNRVTPTEETINSGEYSLARNASLIVSQSALAEQPVQAVLWYIFQDENFSLLVDNNLVGLNFGALPELREEIQTAFAEAQVAVLEVGAEETPEATPEMTPEATEEATPEATEESE